MTVDYAGFNSLPEPYRSILQGVVQQPSDDVKPVHNEGCGLTYFVPLTEEEFALVGKITTLCSGIEYHFDLLFKAIIPCPDDEKYKIITKGKQFGSRVGMMREMSRILSNQFEKELLLKLCTNIDSILRERNAVVHGLWGYRDVGDGQAVAAAYDFKQPDRPVKSTELAAILSRLEQVAAVVNGVWWSIMAPGRGIMTGPIHLRLPADPRPKPGAKSRG